MKQNLVISLLISGIGIYSNVLRSQAIAPQLWNNVGIAWNINEQFSWRNTAAFNVLLSGEYPWSEATLTSTAVLKFHRFMEASAGIYSARTKQTASLSSYELRPFVGFRISTNNEKRWQIKNLSRLELRQLIYPDVDNYIGLRFRNRSYAGVSLNKTSINMTENNLALFGYFEAFFNFGQQVRERFFNQFKYKLGLAYRMNDSWGFDLGFVYQDATNNVILPTQIPTNLITNYVIDWGIMYVIGPKKNNQK